MAPKKDPKATRQRRQEGKRSAGASPVSDKGSLLGNAGNTNNGGQPGT